MGRLLQILAIILSVTKLKYIWSKYINYEKLKITSSFGIYKTIHHNDNYVLFLKNIKFWIFMLNNSSDFQISAFH